MNKERQTANDRETYEAPTCEIIEMQQEGVLCGSGYGASNQGFEDGDKVTW